MFHPKQTILNLTYKDTTMSIRNTYTSDQLSERTGLARIIQKFIEEANVEDYEYDGDGNCCDDCFDEDSCCDDECSCHEFPGFDQNLNNILVNFILKYYTPKEESNEKL